MCLFSSRRSITNLHTFGFGHQQSRCTPLRGDGTDNTIIEKLLNKLSACLYLGRTPSVG